MSIQHYLQFKDHVGHKIVCQENVKHLGSITVKCETCNDVIMDFDRPTPPFGKYPTQESS